MNTVHAANVPPVDVVTKMPSAQEYLGLTKKMGQDKAEGKNMIFRLIRIDGESYFPYVDEIRADRVCVEIDNGKITVATIR
jgi:hypothetical protein